MPGRDGTGPVGTGAMTGWSNGYCITSRSLGLGRSVGRGLGRGLGKGMGFGPGAGMGAWYGCLEEERTILQKRLDMINAQLDNEKKEE